MTKPIQKLFLTSIIVISLMLSANTYGQVKTVQYDVSQINNNTWVLPKGDSSGYQVSNYQHQAAFLLTSRIDDYKSAHIAFPRDLSFSNGIIEVDLATPRGKGSFAGLAFRITDENHYETIYFRPGASATINAIQYMPKIGEDFNWWDYESTKYQGAAILPLTDWFHIKAVVNANTIKIYLNHAETPVFEYTGLDASLKKGSVGFWMGNCTLAAYKNLTVTLQ